MDNNNPTNNNDITIDPAKLAPQGLSPVASNIIDITPGAESTPITPSVVPVQDSVLPDHKVIDITPGSLDDFAPLPATSASSTPPVVEITSPATPANTPEGPTLTVPTQPIISSLPPLEVQPTVLPTINDQAMSTTAEVPAPTAPAIETPISTIPISPVSPEAVNPLQEDPNLVQTIG